MLLVGPSATDGDDIPSSLAPTHKRVMVGDLAVETPAVDDSAVLAGV